MSLRVCVQFPRPDDTSIITRVCPHCKAPNGRRCKTNSGSWCDFHMARILDALGYGRVGGREVYAWKSGPFAKELIKPEPNTVNVRARQAAGQPVGALESIMAFDPGNEPFFPLTARGRQQRRTWQRTGELPMSPPKDTTLTLPDGTVLDRKAIDDLLFELGYRKTATPTRKKPTPTRKKGIGARGSKARRKP